MPDLLERYLACWNETDAVVRRRLIEGLFTPDATYVDPLAEVDGHDGLDAAIGAVQRQFTGLVFSARGELDGHHDVARFGWSLGPAGAGSLVDGFDVVTLDDGRITSVLGFLDKLPG